MANLTNDQITEAEMFLASHEALEIGPMPKSNQEFHDILIEAIKYQDDDAPEIEIWTDLANAIQKLDTLPNLRISSQAFGASSGRQKAPTYKNFPQDY